MQPITNDGRMGMNSFRKHERISLKNDMDRLFRDGRYVFAGGFRCCYACDNGRPYNRIMISVPKKLFKRAVKRNLLKRRIREAYRNNKALLPVVAGTGCDMLIIYIGKDVRLSSDIENGIRELLARLAEMEKCDEKGAGVSADPAR